MKNFITLLCLSLITSFSFLHAQTIDSDKSRIDFEVDNFKWNTVDGTFTGMTGELIFDPSDLISSSFNVCIDAATVDTDSKKRDEHLRTDDFFHVEKYPTICFTSESIEKSGSSFITTGSLTMHGVTRTVKIPFSFDGTTFSGSLEVERYDYGVGADTGTFMVGNEISIDIKCVVTGIRS